MSTAGMEFIRSAAAAEADRRQPMVGYRGNRFAQFAPNSYSADAHSVAAVLSAGSAVRRSFFTEELEVSAAAVDLSRAVAGLVPLLDAHNQCEADAVIGTVSNVRVSGGQLLGTLTFGQTPRAQAVEGMVARGELKGVSIGYQVNAWTIISRDDSGNESWSATNWQLLEVSLVPVPADALTGFRSTPTLQSENEEVDMLTRNAPGGAAAAAPAQPQAAATRFTSTQAIDFIRMAREFQVETAAEELVRRNEAGEIGTEAAREGLLRAAAERQRAEVSGLSGAGVITGQQTFDNPQFFGRTVSDAIYSRMSGTAPTDAAREFRNMTLVGLMTEGLIRAGVREARSMSPTEICNAAFTRGGYNTTSDFPGFLTDGVNRHIIGQFEAAAAAVKTVSRERSASDFRAISGLQLSGFGTLPAYTEGGEIKHGTFQERKETYSVTSFAKMFALSRAAIVNDDLGAFAQAATIMARSAVETEAQLFAELINSNPVMGDAKALFHSGHANLAAAGAAPSVTTLDAGRLAMRSQLDYDGETPLAAAPAYILASPKRETAIEQLLVATINPTQATETNPFHGKLTPLIDPRLDADPWYLFADPGMVPVLEHAYLHGKNGPTVEMQPGWNTLGQEFRVYMDFGAGVVDPRGAYKNPGA
jgi:HK97 family phage prohead protease